MIHPKFAVWAAGVLLHSLSGGVRALAQDVSVPAVVEGHPFSAVKYTRTVQVQPGGQRRITSEAHRVLLARDAHGRILLGGADRVDEQCDLPSLGSLTVCESWSLSLFDPAQAKMWHWSEGERGDKTQLVAMDLTGQQAEKAEELTSVLPTPPQASAGEPGLKFEDLGVREIEGVRATGARYTRTQAVPGMDRARQTIHEMWWSSEMRLVLRVVDGDPAGEEHVTGLRRISLAPDPALFELPANRTVRHWAESSQYAKSDLEWLEQWAVK